MGSIAIVPSRVKQAVAVKHETFCLRYFESGNATEAATLSGYSARSARYQGSRLLKRDNIAQRLTDLRQKAEDASVATVLERKQLYTAVIRGRFADFMSGGVTADKLTSAALKEIRVTEVSLGEGRTKKTTTIVLHDSLRAADLLNKLEGLYIDSPQVSVNVDNRKVEITVISEKAADLTRRIIDGEGTGPAKEETTE